MNDNNEISIEELFAMCDAFESNVKENKNKRNGHSGKVILIEIVEVKASVGYDVRIKDNGEFGESRKLNKDGYLTLLGARNLAKATRNSKTYEEKNVEIREYITMTPVIERNIPPSEVSPPVFNPKVTAQNKFFKLYLGACLKGYSADKFAQYMGIYLKRKYCKQLIMALSRAVSTIYKATAANPDMQDVIKRNFNGRIDMPKLTGSFTIPSVNRKVRVMTKVPQKNIVRRFEIAETPEMIGVN